MGRQAQTQNSCSFSFYCIYIFITEVAKDWFYVPGKSPVWFSSLGEVKQFAVQTFHLRGSDNILALVPEGTVPSV